MNNPKQNNLNYKRYFRRIFGLRILKTAIATSLAIAVAELFNLKTPLMAGISAIVSMTSSVFDSYTVSLNRLLSTILGAIIASFFQFIGFTGYIPIGIGVILVINICNYFKWKKSITLACVVFIIIMLYDKNIPNQVPYWKYGINRTMDTFVGLFVGFTVNYLVFPPNRSTFLLKTYKKTLREFEDAFKSVLTTNKEIEIGRLIDDINEINTELKSIKNDLKMGAEQKYKISHITRINTQFFSAFGLITQLTENGHVPNIDNENMIELEKYFQEPIKVLVDDTNPDFESAFNYYLNDLIKMMFVLREYVYDFEQTLM